MVDHIFSYLMQSVLNAGVVEKLVVQCVPASVNLNLVDQLTIGGGTMHAQPSHLSGEHFVAEEPVSEQTCIGVGQVMAA